MEAVNTSASAIPVVKTEKSSKGLWWFLTRPHPSITDIEMRRQSTLLANIVLVMLVAAAVGAVVVFISGRNRSQLPLLFPGMLAWLVAYIFNRLGRYQVAALIFVGSITALVHLPPLISAAENALIWLLFSGMLMLVSAIFLSTRITVGLFVANIIFQAILLYFKPMEFTVTNQTSLVLFVMLGPLVVVYITYRSGLERDRQAELTSANESLRKSEAELEQRVEERTAELKVAKEEAERANHIKSQFLASMSHELRTPLNSILTFTQLLGMGTFGDVNDEQKGYLDKSLNSGRHLLSLINDVLDVTKIQSGMMKLFVEDDFDVVKEMNDIAAAAEKMLADKPVRLVMDIDKPMPLLTCDKRRVRQVLFNLVSNAVKFTEQGTITLSVKNRAGGIMFAIIDTGPGVAPQERDLIFDPFIQTETGIRHGGGTGLGLPISRSLVESHGGKLWLESAPGVGSSFFVEFPLVPQLSLGEQEV